MPNSPQPAGTHREGIGPRPFAQYQITLDRPEGDPAEIGLTIRDPQEKGPDQWSTSRTPDKLFVTHKLAVDELVRIYNQTVPSQPAAPAVEQDENAGLPDLSLGLDLVTATSDDGSCARATGKGTPCKSKAGAATDHLGTGACKSHEGQPMLVLESV